MTETTPTTAQRAMSGGRLSTVKDAIPEPGEIKEGATKAASEIKQRATRSASKIKEGATKTGSEIKDGAARTASKIKEGATRTASEIKDGAARTASEIKDGAAKAAGEVKGNPVTLGLLSAASGFAVGMIVPLTPMEAQRLPGIADRARELTLDAIQQTRRSGIVTAAEQIESAGQAAIEAVAEQAKKIPVVASVAEKVEETAKRGTRKVARAVREKAGT